MATMKERARKMTEAENRIIEAIREMPLDGNYGEYRSISCLEMTVAKAMEYDTRIFHIGKVARDKKDAQIYRNVMTIIQRMVNRGIIKPSKSGSMFRLMV